METNHFGWNLFSMMRAREESISLVTSGPCITLGNPVSTITVHLFIPNWMSLISHLS